MAVVTSLNTTRVEKNSGDPQVARIVSGEDPAFKEGERTPDDVLNTVRTRLGALRTCVTEAQGRWKEKTNGKLVIEFVVAEDGRVKRTGIRSDTTGDKLLAACIEKEFQALVFPKSAGGDQTYSFPFVLRAAP